ncbi:facilitated trehalose transporter Tret1 isoform X2 [Cimex lectularius]|nr:facilitated trehalose transporter Tret1 isoform X2 [Cimex lectularius]XP_014254952.1 facilitated trehalose transporter Tret1 isoform X2 [Cimex lectularius]XP_024085686.1 facilitated trehalose transporter Tret1 isoform X2 [Cimex lectularius]
MNEPGSRLHVSPQEASWIGALLPLVALVGGILGGPLIEHFGRKRTILCSAGPFIFSFLLIAFARNVAMIMAGRAIGGFSIGVASLALPLYLGECLQADVRGTLGLFPTTFGNGGILLAFFAGKYLTWDKLALFGATLSVPFMALMFFMPETPRWYVNKGEQKKAKNALQWLRGSSTDISKEFSDICGVDNLDGSPSSPISELFTKKYLLPISISLGLMFFQQLSGINAVIFYTVSIFKDAGSTIDSNLSSIIVGLVNVGATLMATLLIDRLGRKVLMYISNSLMTLTLGVLGTFFYLKNQGYDMSQYGWVPLSGFVIYVIGFSIGAGPIPWLMMGEILPAKIRGTAASIATGFNWTCTFLVTKTFIDLRELIGAEGVFWLFSMICTVGVVFVAICVPETQGKSLEDIERNFTGENLPVRRVKRLSSLASIKPLPSSI